jgi:hypothetical protein
VIKIILLCIQATEPFYWFNLLSVNKSLVIFGCKVYLITSIGNTVSLTSFTCFNYRDSFNGKLLRFTGFFDKFYEEFSQFIKLQGAFKCPLHRWTKWLKDIHNNSFSGHFCLLFKCFLYSNVGYSFLLCTGKISNHKESNNLMSQRYY